MDTDVQPENADQCGESRNTQPREREEQLRRNGELLSGKCDNDKEFIQMVLFTYGLQRAGVLA